MRTRIAEKIEAARARAGEVEPKPLPEPSPRPKRKKECQPRCPVRQEYFDYEQAGQYIGKSAEAIRKYVQLRLIKVIKRGPKLRWIARTELDEFMLDRN